jgi:serine/threonine protein kinase
LLWPERESQTEEQVKSAKATVAVGVYDLLEKIGRGGMGTIYRGRHRFSGQLVAVKVLAPSAAADPVLRKRFEQEFLAASRLHHPHIVQGLDLGLAHDPPYLVMEFVEGPNLGQLVREHGRLPEAQAVGMIVQIAQGLHQAHQNKLIHRDIKPDNILLSKSGEAKLADLGLVKDLESTGDLTRSRTCLGTACFMAPEQYDDAKRVGVTSDVYALAASLYWALTGLLPFPSRGHLTLLKKKLADDFVPPISHVPSLNARVNETICRSLKRDPGLRPASCAEFVKALTGHNLEQHVTTMPLPIAKKGKDRRRAARYLSTVETVCRPVSQVGSYAAEVLDMSTTGIRLLVEHQFPAGSLLVIEVQGETADLPRLWLVRVVWACAQGKKWALGAAFINALTPEEVKALVEKDVSTVVIKH